MSVIEKPKRKTRDWHNAKWGNCGCGRWARLADDWCAECHDEEYNSEVEMAYCQRIKELEAALSLSEALLQYEREKNTRAEKGEARKLTVTGWREW